MLRTTARLIGSIVAAVLLTMGGAGTATAATVVDTGGTAQVIPQMPAPNWVPWDGNHITTYAKCQNRLNFIAQTYNIPTSDLQCRSFQTLTCPPTTYWVLYVNNNSPAAIVISSDTSTAFQEPVAPAVC